jgi:hypothetical protein
MDGIDLAREVKMRWPLLPVILTWGHPRERVGELPLGVAYMPKPWQPLNTITIIRPETLVRWASRRFPPVLAFEVPVPWRPAANRRGPACADPPNSRFGQNAPPQGC